jgi:hypothetical protein
MLHRTVLGTSLGWVIEAGSFSAWVNDRQRVFLRASGDFLLSANRRESARMKNTKKRRRFE